MRGANREGGLVYSSDTGRRCRDCGAAIAACVCAKREATQNASSDGFVRVGRETKGRKGAGVTLVNGLALDNVALTALATRLKKRCGSGGTVKDGVIEIQGEHRETVAALLRDEGWKVKVIGA